ncbi:MAG: FHA domain-containing protein [Anaerolineae bacterium]|nr:FHA domain-containing protein [Anaerolineae bacterium]
MPTDDGTRFIKPDPEDTLDSPRKSEVGKAVKAGATLDIEWIKTRSDEELISLIHVLSTELNLRKIRFTDSMPIASLPRSISLDDKDIKVDKFIRKPPGAKKPFGKKAWQIILVCLDKEHEPLGLEIVDDITIGRLTDETPVDLDLNPYHAEEYGVSREHAMLRPSDESLLISDLGSTNGTYYEGSKVVLGQPKPIKNGSVISFGKLNFWVKVVNSPRS